MPLIPTWLIGRTGNLWFAAQIPCPKDITAIVSSRVIIFTGSLWCYFLPVSIKVSLDSFKLLLSHPAPQGLCSPFPPSFSILLSQDQETKPHSNPNFRYFNSWATFPPKVCTLRLLGDFSQCVWIYIRPQPSTTPLSKFEAYPLKSQWMRAWVWDWF